MMNKHLSVVFSVLLILVLSGCDSKSPQTGAREEAPTPVETAPVESVEVPIPSSHVWQYLHSYGEEDEGYATYSYILVGRDQRDEKTNSLYYELIDTIQASTADAKVLEDVVPRSSLNIFLIPIESINGNKKPNYKLSKAILSSLSVSSPIKFSKPGPYIITLHYPISNDISDELVDILYIDLTNMHAKAIKEIVRTFKEKVLDQRLEG